MMMDRQERIIYTQPERIPYRFKRAKHEMHYVKKKKKPATSTAAQAEANAISKTTTKIYEQH